MNTFSLQHAVGPPLSVPTCYSVAALRCVHVSAFRTHMKGLCLPIFGPDLRFPDGCQVGSAHCQQSPTTEKEKELFIYLFFLKHVLCKSNTVVHQVLEKERKNVLEPRASGMVHVRIKGRKGRATGV